MSESVSRLRQQLWRRYRNLTCTLPARLSVRIGQAGSLAGSCERPALDPARETSPSV